MGPVVSRQPHSEIIFDDNRSLLRVAPDGYPRRGMSVVAALTQRPVHTNRRRNGSWTHCYQHGIPVTGLTPIPDDGTTGTALRFLPDSALVSTRTSRGVSYLSWPLP